MPEIKITSHKGWSNPQDGIFVPHTLKFQEKLSPGMYDVGHSSQLGFYLSKTALSDHDVFEFSGTKTEEVISDIKNFWAREKLFRQYNFPYKRGILLYGPPGCGKSSTISLVCREVMKLNGFVIKFNAYFIQGLRLVKKVQPEVPIVCLMEDLDDILRDHSISEILNLLDGVEGTIDNVVYLATTNNPERLHQNIKNRPSRFDRRFEFKEPDIESRKIYLKRLFKDDCKVDVERWAKDTKGFSFAHLKELFVSVILFGNKYEAVVKELGGMKKAISSDDEFVDDE